MSIATLQSTISRLVDPQLRVSQRQPALRAFAQHFGWRPSETLEDYPGVETVANGHLVVEHGLDNTAVITFLKKTHPFVSLETADVLRLASISYNNLVDWHIFPDPDGVTAIYNRAKPVWPKRFSIYDDRDVWRAEAFERITSDHPSPNLKNLEQALIDTVSLWKRSLAADLGSLVTTEGISALFNAIFFVRALEDYRRLEDRNAERALLNAWDSGRHRQTPLRGCIIKCLESLGALGSPKDLLNIDLLAVFDSLDRDTVAEILQDFYSNRFAPYEYDFSLMSKHALSRIYEKYVALLRDKDSEQLMLLPELPEETANRSLGAVYTPQYIARFFARFLRDNNTPRMFRSLRTADPACGSGMFLRTLLEMQCDPFQYETVDKHAVSQAFGNVLGIDWDSNACHATRLSLALLHLVLLGDFPPTLNVVNSEAIEYYQDHSELKSRFDAVIANPPFIRWDRLGDELRLRITEFMGSLAAGKMDAFLAHLKLGLEMVRPGGHLLYVLPHSFLLAKNAAALRRELAKTCWIRVLVDLSEVPVFGELGSYVVLLVAQKRAPSIGEEPRAVLVRCREFVGHALYEALEGHTVSTEFYDISETSQRHFEEEHWRILSPEESRLLQTIQSHPPLEKYLEVKQGMVTGADDVFIIRKSDVPEGEGSVYALFLPDRAMERYHVPSETDTVVFYPYLDNRLLEEAALKVQFPDTWSYLCSKRDQLCARRSVVRGDFPWWRPERPRPPQAMLRPKIVSPHLTVLPRFSLDARGLYAISRSPLMYPVKQGNEEELLQYFLAILNSPVAMWQIVHLSHKYSRGYAMLERKTLVRIGVPDPGVVPMRTMKRLLSLVSKRLESGREPALERQIDEIVADLYALTRAERELVGMELGYE